MRAPELRFSKQEIRPARPGLGQQRPLIHLCLFYVRVALIKGMEHSLIVGGVKVLEFLFAAGLSGSVVLILLTSIEDFREVFHADAGEEPLAD